MDAHWIVTGNSGRARIFRQETRTGPLEEVDDMINDAARLRTAETETDDLGRRGSSTGLPRSGTPSPASGYQPHTTPAEHQTELFARDVSACLTRGHQQGRFRALTLAASPEFLGVLRKALDASVAQSIDLAIDKDYSRSTATALQAQLAKQREKP